MSYQGQVKSFNTEKGFGFILGPDGTADIFLHIKACVDGGVPQAGDTVAFDMEPSQLKPGQMVSSNVTGGTGVAGQPGVGAAAGQKGGGKAAAGAVGTGSNQGQVKTFNPAKGFGFIVGANGSADIFLHANACVDGGVPQQGDIILFDVEPSKLKPGQMQASNVSGGTGAGFSGLSGAVAQAGGWQGGAVGSGKIQGQVKSFNVEKGFGFIIGADGNDVFLHANACVDGATPQQGDILIFDMEASKSKPGQMVAQNVSGGTGGAGAGGCGMDYMAQMQYQMQVQAAMAAGMAGAAGYGAATQAAPAWQAAAQAAPAWQAAAQAAPAWQAAATAAPAWQAAAPAAGGTGQIQGQVKSFNAEKGFGFITGADGVDVFLHVKACVDGATPQQGDVLIFDVEASKIKPGQMVASNVTGGTAGAGAGGGGCAMGGGAGKGGYGKAGGTPMPAWQMRAQQAAPYSGVGTAAW